MLKGGGEGNNHVSYAEHHKMIKSVTTNENVDDSDE